MGAAGLTLGIQYGAGRLGVALRVVHFRLLQCSGCTVTEVLGKFVYLVVQSLFNCFCYFYVNYRKHHLLKSKRMSEI